MTTKKKTMYEILDVSPTASYADIKAAHRRLSLQLMSGTSSLNREEIDFKLNVLDLALHTLLVPVSRDAYDVELAAATAPIKGNVVSLGDEARTRRIVAAIEDNYKIAAAAMDSHQLPTKAVSLAVAGAATALKKILRVFIGLVGFLFVLKMGQMALANRQAGHPSREVAKAEEKIAIQEYYKKYGVRPASKAEAELLETENRRKENEQRAAAFAVNKQEEEYRQFVDESRKLGESVSERLARDEQRARYEEMQEKQRQSYLAEEKRIREEEEERVRIANARKGWGLD